ncbi:MAG TPA: DUF1499 domain-containing protein [Alphaproteobacteria bacterium]
MTTATLSSDVRSRIFASAPIVGFGLAVIAVVLLALAPIGWRAGWWHYRTSFFYLMTYAGYAGLAALIISALGLLGIRSIGRRGLVMALIGLVVGAGFAYVPWHWNQLRTTVPPIHDITTDFTNPPEFSAVLPARIAEEGNPVTYDSKVGEQQKQAYGDIAPVTLALPPPEAFKRALDAANAKGWAIVATDPASGRIEASDTSFWFRFTDDISVRVTATGSASRIDVRSVSRQGRSDFGVNAARIRGYTAALRAAG